MNYQQNEKWSAKYLTLFSQTEIYPPTSLYHPHTLILWIRRKHASLSVWKDWVEFGNNLPLLFLPLCDSQESINILHFVDIWDWTCVFTLCVPQATICPRSSDATAAIWTRRPSPIDRCLLTLAESRKGTFFYSSWQRLVLCLFQKHCWVLFLWECFVI